MSKKNEPKMIMQVNNQNISIFSTSTNEDFISITDIAKFKNSEFPADVIKNWLRLRNTIDFLGVWEKLNNPNFKLVEFDQFKIESGTNSFVLSPQKWISSTNAIGLKSKSGRYGGTFAHKDIAFEFASWISPEFKLYIIKEYQILKEDSMYRQSLEWNVNRIIAKANYKIHTDMIKDSLIPPDLSNHEKGYIYASEADLLNLALFGITASEWRNKNPDKKGNIRDNATVEQLLVLSNLESINANLISKGMSKEKRLIELNKIAMKQMASLSNSNSIKTLKSLNSSITNNFPKLN